MTIAYKTYARGRAAKAALTKLLVDSHEVPVEHFQITEVAVDDRFTAKVDFLVAQPPFVIMDVVEAGFPFTDPEASASDDGIVSWKVSAAVAAAAVADIEAVMGDTIANLETKALAEAAAAKTKTKYIHETSGVVGATKLVWAIADSMPGAARKDVIEACRARGIAFGTARTQYQKWFVASKA